MLSGTFSYPSKWQLVKSLRELYFTGIIFWKLYYFHAFVLHKIVDSVLSAAEMVLVRDSFIKCYFMNWMQLERFIYSCVYFIVQLLSSWLGQVNPSLIYQACASLEPNYQPPVTFVVVQKRHHTRLFANNHADQRSVDRSGNILPGQTLSSCYFSIVI